MIDAEIERFDIRATTRREVERYAAHAKNMLIAASAASLAIVGAGAFLLSLL
jgi:hypothetical protein